MKYLAEFMYKYEEIPIAKAWLNEISLGYLTIVKRNKKMYFQRAQR